MADKSIGNSTLEELEELLRDEEFSHMFDAPRNKAPAAGSESASSAGTTPGLLNTAFLNETDDDEQDHQRSFPATQSQTSHEASSTMRSLINTILEREPGVIHAGGAKKIMVSTGTMPMTPIKMLSSATMPRTPNQMTSIGTMPKTPTIVSTGTMPKTPTRPATTTSFSVSDNEPIVLSSPTPSIIDLVSPTVETIDLCSQSTPTNTDSPRPATN